MNVSGYGQILMGLTQQLTLRWEQTRESWKDAKSDEFERDHLNELFSATAKASEVFDQLDKILSKVRNDCE